MPTEQLRTNQVQPYYRAPHVLVGFPMCYNERGWSEPMLDLPGYEERVTRVGQTSDRKGPANPHACAWSAVWGLGSDVCPGSVDRR